MRFTARETREEKLKIGSWQGENAQFRGKGKRPEARPPYITFSTFTQSGVGRRWHNTWCVGLSWRSGGAVVLQMAWAIGQRV
jgi:hypothetical protein